MEPQHHNNKNQNVLMAVFAYLGPLVFIPLLVDKEDPFVKFHIKQGLVLFCIELIVWLLTPMFFWPLWFVFHLINLCTLILAIIGIINALQKQEKMLPLVGSFSSYFKF